MAGALPSSVAAKPTASRIVDRTFSCEAGFLGGLHRVGLYSSYRADAGSTVLRAFAGVTPNIYASHAGISSEGFSVNRELCIPSRRTARLTTKGLRGGATPPLGAEATCETSPRLLLRVRAVFERPVTPRTSRESGLPQLTASGALETAAILVATKSGTPIAYLSVTGDEKARFFTRPTCKED